MKERLKKWLLVYLMFSLVIFPINIFAEETDNNNQIQNDTLETEAIPEEKISDDKQEDDTTEQENDTTEQENVQEQEYEMQDVKVYISKIDVNGNDLVGAKLQILDANNNAIEEWTSDGTKHEVILKGGKYTLHEVAAPAGYKLAEDKLLEVEVIIESPIIGNVEWSDYPCNHGDGKVKTPLYYIEIDSVSYEVYCVNQGWATPEGIDYTGKILTADEIRKFTIQETDIDDGEPVFNETKNRFEAPTKTVSDYDVSDQSLTNQQLYDKVLDIIYHRQKAMKEEKFKDLTEAEIRFITEYALKNYLNARITTFETVRFINGNKVDHIRFNRDGELWQDGDGTKYIKLINKYYNREYKYDVNSKLGFVIVPGEGDAFGNLAKHWYENHGKVQIPAVYAELFYYLISDELPHPAEMQLYMYSTSETKDGEPYQNVLGITGFHEDADIKKQYFEMIDEYSDEVTDVSITKKWDDADNQDGIRPEKIEVTLSNGETVTLNDQNNWSATVKDLPVYKEGNLITYTWSEVKTEGYELTNNTTEGYVTTLTNTHIPEVTDVSITKKWDDADNQDGIRPEKIEVTLSNGETVTLNDQNNWSATVKDLPVYKEGNLITYTWSEVKTEGYELTNNTTEGYVTTLTNTHTPEVTDLTIKKVWDDFNNVANLRPTEIKVTVYANDELYKEILITETEDWQVTLKNLPKYKNGTEIIYTVKEEEIFEYETTYEEDTKYVLIIRNYHELGKGNGPEEEPPQTGYKNKSSFSFISILFSMIIAAFIKKIKG